MKKISKLNILSIIDIITFIVMLYLLLNINILPTKYLILIIVIISIINILSIIFINIKKKIFKIIGIILIIVAIIINIIGTYYLYYANNFLDKSFSYNEKTVTTYYIVTNKSNNYTKKDINGDIYYYDNNSIDIMKSFLDHSFLINYSVLDSMARLKRDEKKNMTKYATIILTEEINRVMTLLASCGYKTTEEELLSLIAKELKDEKKNRSVSVNADDVKKKFKTAMEEYLERTQKYL